MIQVLPEDWIALELIENGRCGGSIHSVPADAQAQVPDALIRLGERGFIRAKGADQFEITKDGWHALRQHRRVCPD